MPTKRTSNNIDFIPPTRKAKESPPPAAKYDPYISW